MIQDAHCGEKGSSSEQLQHCQISINSNFSQKASCTGTVGASLNQFRTPIETYSSPNGQCYVAKEFIKKNVSFRIHAADNSLSLNKLRRKRGTDSILLTKT